MGICVLGKVEEGVYKGQGHGAVTVGSPPGRAAWTPPEPHLLQAEEVRGEGTGGWGAAGVHGGQQEPVGGSVWQFFPQ